MRGLVLQPFARFAPAKIVVLGMNVWIVSQPMSNLTSKLPRNQITRTAISENRWFFLALIALIIPPIYWLIAYVKAGWFPTGDEALIAIRMYDAWTGNWPLVGMRSTSTETDPNIMAYHPGPMQFYLFGLPYLLFGWTNLGLLAAGVIMLVFFVAIALWHGQKAAGIAGLTVIFASVVMLYGLFGSALILPWNPWPPVMGLLACFALAWRMLMGDSGLWPLFIFCVSFVGQAHLGLLPIAVFLGMILLGQALYRWYRHPQRLVRRSEVKWALIVGVICWFGPIVNFLNYSPSNVVEIIRLSGSDKPPAGEPMEPLNHVTYVLFPWIGGPRAAGEISFFGVVVFVVALAILVETTWRRRKQEEPEYGLEYAAYNGVALGVFGVLVTLWSANRTGGGLRVMFVDYMMAAPVFLWACIVLWVVARLKALVPAIWIRNGQLVGVAAVAAAVTLAVIVPYSLQKQFVGQAYQRDIDQTKLVVDKLMPILAGKEFAKLPVAVEGHGLVSWAGIQPTVAQQLVVQGRRAYFSSPWPRPADDDFRRAHNINGTFVDVYIEDVGPGEKPTRRKADEEFTVPMLNQEGGKLRVHVTISER